TNVLYGWAPGLTLVRKMGAGLWAIRSTIPDGVARVLFTTVGASMVLLHGFIKKSAKTPDDDLKLAKQRKKEVHDE
ncbi:type II toxin-antitoxin system RelE/ParE family toxin, partial [Citrobacter braakii]|uniref:type II toxin-antitoxin system RelE/ParE family toxin n=1 Tax=Citrobacter braakii TaxID=57706 RepID=UPI00197F1261